MVAASDFEVYHLWAHTLGSFGSFSKGLARVVVLELSSV